MFFFFRQNYILDHITCTIFLLLGNLFTLLAKSKGFFILLLLQLQKEKKAREEQEKRDAEEAAERQQREEEWVRKMVTAN